MIFHLINTIVLIFAGTLLSYFKKAVFTFMSIYSDRQGFVSGITIREYVGMGDVNRIDDEEAISRALSLSGAADIVKCLPHGLDTKLGEALNDTLYCANKSLGIEPKETGYFSPSDGQKRKLAPAQALMAIDRASLFILDEPESNLDAKSREELLRYIRMLRGEKTTMVVTHDIKTLEKVDKILVMEGGKDHRARAI
jgi:ATP-binding cassette, subfamily B, bacterial